MAAARLDTYQNAAPRRKIIGAGEMNEYSTAIQAAVAAAITTMTDASHQVEG
ncbi:hypothetical protein HQ325_16990 [Rhodococcus sp. BP-349]|uniref:hypothetical protein n=1 Tax=unclassified Rhodococcus (in: high G+C Gram-positive bacteria) TaxID=192944 RepID=UPI001C9A4E80|nr:MULTISPECIES: hypothetical protein [unclassified Rhodococcus (in: high G+C Gram-positive bacteria)]MBY6540373.1 hypothetical protein [Rhodococcus sp. BP-363]MBY6545602.1 hypothetical protein [Rhodococcus sp. BP-369]MBY6564832.1 hypothetical protein [Rhodococcus sp. BP-370]MBY6578232.1 hypothetical protein [Rhodococcus sp. BP-364]MBY6587533.1 hypothetical protein [Rhodococcus sp. BP-358]